MHEADRTEYRPSPRLTYAALACVLALAFAVRALPDSRIVTPEGVRPAADGDTYYHVLRAERIAADWPTIPWSDPGMNHPNGAAVPWAGLLDPLVAAAAVATGPATPDHVARVAVRIPPYLGTLLVAVVAATASALIGRGAWAAALLVALLPAAVRQSFVGRVDHHVLEVLLGSLAVLALVRGMRRPGSRLWPAALAVAIALSFWNWSGSALSLALLCAGAGALHLAVPREGADAARTLAIGSAGAAALLVVSVAAWGPPGALTSPGLTPITALAPLVCAAAAAGAGGIRRARRLDPRATPGRRALHLVAIVAALGGGTALAAAAGGATGGLSHGLTALGAASPWYEAVAECWPLVGSGRQPWTFELRLAAIAFGLTPLVLPFAAVGFVRAWRRAPGRRAELLVLAVWVLYAFGLALLRRRFEGYAVVPLALAAAAILPPVDGVRRGLAAGAIVLVLAAPGLPISLTGAVVELPAGAEDRQPLLSWLAGVPSAPGREGVLSTWHHGHEIQWLARKPVVSTPFGTDIDPRSLEDEATFFTTLEPDAAEALLRRRRVGFLLLENPVREVATLGALAPGAPAYALEERGLSTGSRYAMRPEFFDLVAARLYFDDGGTRDGRGAFLDAYRLLAESATEIEVLGARASAYKLFGVVEGARVRVVGAAPGDVVEASVEVRTNRGRSFAWRRAAVAGATGEAEFRVPYATGANGLAFAGPCSVRSGNRAARVSVPEASVRSGDALAAPLVSASSSPAS